MRYLCSFACAGLFLVWCLVCVNGCATAKVLGTSPIRVVTYNIHGGRDRHDRLTIDEIARELRDQRPDVACLQEVFRNTPPDDRFPLPAGVYGVDQPAYLASVIGDSVTVYHAPSDGTIPPTEGTGVTIIQTEPGFGFVVQLNLYDVWADEWYGDRVAAVTRFRGAWVMCTHLNPGARYHEQEVVELLKAVALLSQTGDPVILAGDLNDLPGSATLEAIKSQGFRHCTPDARIDHIFALGMGCGESWQQNSGASDHPLVGATVRPQN